MTLPASGAITMAQVNTELGYASNAAITLNDAAVRALAGVPSGAISMSNLHGKSATIPAGLIIMSADGSTPSGWTRFSAADSKFIVGAGSTYSVTSTGGSSSVSANVDSSSNGSHSNHPSQNGYTYMTPNYRGYYLSKGNHPHAVSASEYTPERQNIVLIKANGVNVQAPAYGLFFGISTLSGFTATGTGGFIMGYSSISTAAHTKTVSCGSAGTHNHNYDTSTGGGTQCHVSSGSHTHTLTVGSPVNNFKNAVLRGLYKASAFAPVAGLIAMWEGATAPAGWTLCNGANATVDLRDYFIYLSSTGTGTKPGAQNATITMTVGLDSTSWSHTHEGGNAAGSDYQGENSVQYVTATHSHTHAGLTLSSYTPVYYALTFIQYTG